MNLLFVSVLLKCTENNKIDLLIIYVDVFLLFSPLSSFCWCFLQRYEYRRRRRRRPSPVSSSSNVAVCVCLYFLLSSCFFLVEICSVYVSFSSLVYDHSGLSQAANDPPVSYHSHAFKPEERYLCRLDLLCSFLAEGMFLGVSFVESSGKDERVSMPMIDPSVTQTSARERSSSVLLASRCDDSYDLLLSNT